MTGLQSKNSRVEGDRAGEEGIIYGIGEQAPPGRRFSLLCGY